MRHRRRLDRQFAAMTRALPALRRTVQALLAERMRIVRLPLSVMFIAGSALFILPGFGLWMLPLGLLLLAVDIPALQPTVSAAVIRARRRLRGMLRR